MAPKGSAKKGAAKKKGVDPEAVVEGAMMEGLTLSMKQAKVIHRRDSKLNGDILVEELVVKGAPPGTVVRRMRFMSNLELEQTEVRLVIQADGRAIADREYLPSAVPASHIDCVELDPAVADIAREFFDLRDDPGIKVHVADGIDFVAAAPEDWYDISIMDVNACDEDDKTLEAPPRPFITEEFINAWARATKPGGVAAMNVLCSDPALFATILLRIRTAFGGSVSFLKDMADDADENYVVYVLKPLAGASVEAPSAHSVAEKAAQLEAQIPSLRQFALPARAREQFLKFEPENE